MYQKVLQQLQLAVVRRLRLFSILCVGAGGTNAYIWAAWAYLEQKLGNVTRARQLYDAGTVADPKHAAAWHGWGLLEKQQDNVLRARDIWLKVDAASMSISFVAERLRAHKQVLTPGGVAM